MHLHQRQNDPVSTAIILWIPPPFSPEQPIPPPLLPEELIREILLRLPVKYLVQFKRVCKSWKTLISDSQFIKDHLHISRITRPQLVFSVLEEPYKIVSYSLKPFFQNWPTPVVPVTFGTMKYRNRSIIGSCNGLLCVFHIYHNTLKLWNPSIRFKTTKSPQAVPSDWFIMQYGFGYDQVNDKYKVLLVARHKHDITQSLTKIYTFGQNIWKTIPNFSIRPTSRIGKFVSGTLNWMVYKGAVDSNQFMIFSFDVEKETYREMLLPQNDGPIYMRSHNNLYVLSDCLCVWDRNGVVWLMKEYGVVESWTKLMITPLVMNTSYSEDPLFISENSVLFMRTWSGYRTLANGTSFGKRWYISEEGHVTRIPKSSCQLVLYNSNIDWCYPLIDITGTIGLDQHIHCESLVSLQW